MKSFARVIRSVASDQNELRRERLLKVLSAATFLIFFQACMGVPLIPRFRCRVRDFSATDWACSGAC